MVAVSHLLTAFKPELHNPAVAAEGASLWLQLPILRLCMAGPTALALFFIISGYVCSYKILVQNRKDPEIAMKSLSRATLTRPVRLILPAATATMFSWILAEAGAYTMTGKIDAEWIRNGRKYPDKSLLKAIARLVTACIKTWTEGWDEYDGTQWPMVLLLESSILCYITLLATAYVSPRMRRALFVVVFMYGWMGGQGEISSRSCACAIFLTRPQPSRHATRFLE
jgi:peptidoglycan/LPS O-acetylase OafA/YrhL